MPLIECPECGKEISDQSHNCPHCGYPLRDSQETKLQREADTIWERFKDWSSQDGCFFWVMLIGFSIIFPPAGIPLFILVIIARFASGE